MVPKKFTTIAIVFNAVMGFLLFLSSQLTLLALIGYKVVSVDIVIRYDYAFSFQPTPPTPVLYPLPNYPLIVLIFTLIVNLLLYVRIRRSKD
jgi:hypothetical protein